MDMPKVYIIVLNWNGWQDTLVCLESVFKISYSNYRVIVCDNGSTDGSLDKIKAWADGNFMMPMPKWQKNECLEQYINNPLPKPIPYLEYTKEESQYGGKKEEADEKLILIQTGGNLGFAGGNNVAMRYALACDDFDYVWLLNNDTIVTPESLNYLIKRMREKPDAGICGSTLLQYDNPDIVQAYGGATVSKWTYKPKNIGSSSNFSMKLNNEPNFKKNIVEYVENKMVYVLGASMVVSKEFIVSVGLLWEGYFIYYEEIDWILSGNNKFSLACATDSIVYHKGEGSTNPKIGNYYFLRNKIVFQRRHFIYGIPIVCIKLLIKSIGQLLMGKWDRVQLFAKATMDGFRVKIDD